MSQEIKPAPQMICDLMFACDRAPYTNMLESYAAVARVRPEECEFHFATEFVTRLPDHYVAMHVGPVGSDQFHWVGRDWFTDRFAAVSQSLAERRISTVLIGDSRVSNRGELWPLGTVDLRGKTNVHQLGYVVKHSRLFIGLDSFPMHLAQTLNVAGVVFFGCVLPSHRIYRENVVGVNAAHLPCIGCHHESTLYRELGICETSVCKVGDEPCRGSVSLEMFMNAVNIQLTRTEA
jgi:ADP-heptose:LPS heptosyltransferase